MENIDQVQVKHIALGWSDIDFTDLKKDDKFRLFNSRGAVVDEFGRSIWIASSKPYLNEKGLYMIHTYAS